MLQAGVGGAAISRGFSVVKGNNLVSTTLRGSLVFIIELEGAIVESRGPVKEFFALAENELAQKNWYEFFLGAEEIEALQAEIAELEVNAAFNFISNFTATGKIFHWFGFVFAGEGQALRVALMAEDVTEYRESSRKLEKYMVELERMGRAQSSRELRMGEMRRKIGGLEKSLVRCENKGGNHGNNHGNNQGEDTEKVARVKYGR